MQLPVVTITHIHTGTDIAPLQRHSLAIPAHKQWVLELPVDNSLSIAELCDDALDYMRECCAGELPAWFDLAALRESLMRSEEHTV